MLEGDILNTEENSVRDDLRRAVENNPFLKNPYRLKRLLGKFDQLSEYAKENGRLPKGFGKFRGATDSLFEGTTHVSPRDWGWLGKHDYIALIRFNTSLEDPIQVIAIVPSETPKWHSKTHELERRARLEGIRTKVAEEKHELPRFKRY